MEEITVVGEIAGKKFTFSTGLLAKQANGSVLLSIEKTQVLGTVTMSKAETNGDFFPLSVHYTGKYYAAGRIPGGYFRREGKPLDSETLVSRLIDRPLRPLFPDGFRNEVQVIPTVLSIDGINPADIAGMNAASASLVISDIPFSGPVGAVRVGFIDNQFIINPTHDEMIKSRLELIVAGTKKAITMIEGEADELSEEDMLTAVTKAHDEIKKIIELQNQLKEKAGKTKRSINLHVHDTSLKEKISSSAKDKLKEALTITDKLLRDEKIAAVFDDTIKGLGDQITDDVKKEAADILHDVEKDIVRNAIVLENKRPDGRSLEEIRPISIKMDILENVHGSALFTRGQTQSLGIATLGSTKDVLKIDEVSGNITKNFYLHYNFPPFSVGETGRPGATGRREIGHGMLAERSLFRQLPSSDEFGYTIRVVSEILESNGSSSMASVCSGSLALMSAGVPLKNHVAGIAMGLVMAGEKYKILTDIQGMEDHLGDMDFKVAGTRSGITGFQLDIKIEGITIEIMREAVAQAKRARLAILDKMYAAIEKPRQELNPKIPQYTKMSIPVDKIRNVIGPGGKMIKSIVEQTGSDIDIDDSGKVIIFAKNREALDHTMLLVEGATGVPKIGAVYNGTVRRVVPFGAFIEVMPGTDGLCHISELAKTRVGAVTDVVNEGDAVKVKVIGIDDQGRVKLSMKALD